MNAERIIRAAIPSADAEIIDYIMWERTPWPIANISARELYKVANRSHRAAENGIVLCDLCDNKVQKGDWTCDRCVKIMNRAQKND